MSIYDVCILVDTPLCTFYEEVEAENARQATELVVRTGAFTGFYTITAEGQKVK